MIIGRLKVNHLDTPMGFFIDAPVFSWNVVQSTGKFQKEARLTVSTVQDMSCLIYDSGISSKLNCLGEKAEWKLLPRTRYYWQVEVWADDSDYGASPVSWFETGKMDESWSAVWIQAPYGKEIHPYMRHEFSLEEKIVKARVYVCGLGLYELEINGQKAGDEYLMPGYYDYTRWLQYQTYDVTGLLQQGSNCLGAMLGNGWYKGRLGFVPDMDEVYGDRMMFLCELHVVTESGKEIVTGTGNDWDCHPSPVLESSIYNGEVYDAGLETEGFSMPGLCLETWEKAVKSDAVSVPLIDRLSPLLRMQECIKPSEVIHTPAGELVLDFGQEMTGWVEFSCDLPAGSHVLLQYGEILQNGNFYNDNLRTAKAEYLFISAGKPAMVRPHFTYYGFRYVKVTGLREEELKDVCGCVLHSDLERTGYVETSSQDVNRLFLNALWGQKGNFLDVPTDCPQRDERLGWTGDAQVFAATATYNMDTAAFYRKYLYDMLLEQQDLGGAVPDVVPNTIGRVHRLTAERNGEAKNDQKHSAGACAWGDAAAVIPWTMYLFYGDKSLLEDQFENMCLWVDYIKRQDEENCQGTRLWTCGFHYADWLALDNPDKESRFGGTDCYYVASAYYYYSAWLTYKAAKVLGKEQEAAVYGQLAAEIKESFCNTYYGADKKPVIQTQTALVMALYLDLIPESTGARTYVTELLGAKLESRNVHLDTGFVGTPWLCPALSGNGMQEYAYTLLLQEDFPSWLYEVRMGATTIWERWNSVLPDGSISGTGMNSLNHYAYGSIAEWMYRSMCGINPMWEEPGFRKAIIRPQTDTRLTWAHGRYLSPMGEYDCRWELKEGITEYQVSIPFGAQAEFVLEECLPEFQNSHKDVCSIEINGIISEKLKKTGRTILLPGTYKIKVQEEKQAKNE